MKKKVSNDALNESDLEKVLSGVLDDEAIRIVYKIYRKLKDLQFEVDYILKALNYLSERIGKIEDELRIDSDDDENDDREGEA